jgi:eukaryotic translation initiation factor 2C
MDEANVPTNKFQAMIYEHCYQYMRSTTPVSLYPAVYYAHLASNRARAHEDVSASDGPRGGSKFVEKNAVNEVLHAHGIGSSLSGSRDRDTEAKPLLQLGAAAPEATKASIKASMWYI